MWNVDIIDVRINSIDKNSTDEIISRREKKTCHFRYLPLIGNKLLKINFLKKFKKINKSLKKKLYIEKQLCRTLYNIL